MSSYGNVDNRGVHLSKLYDSFKKFDKNNDGLSRGEINFAADDARKNGQKDVYEVLSTFLVGGRDEQGLMPDVNGDNRLQFSELKDLANHSNDRNVIDVQDFMKGFGYRAKPGGNALPPVQGGGYPQPPSYGAPPNYGPPSNGGGYPPQPPSYGGGQQGGMNGLMQAMLKLFQQIIPLLTQQSSSHYGPPPTNYGPPPTYNTYH